MYAKDEPNTTQGESNSTSRLQACVRARGVESLGGGGGDGVGLFSHALWLHAFFFRCSFGDSWYGGGCLLSYGDIAAASIVACYQSPDNVG